MSVENKTFLFYDSSGGYSHLAESIAPDVGAVCYFSQWQSAFPRVRDALPGVGLDGVERVPDFFDALPRADVVVFCDVGHAGLQKWLVDQGVAVWGAGVGSRLEQDRELLKKVPVRVGVLVAVLRAVRVGVGTLQSPCTISQRAPATGPGVHDPQLPATGALQKFEH